MTSASGTRGLNLADSPPLWVPASFLLVPPVAMIAAGGLVGWAGPAALTSTLAPATLALTHLGTLGLLASAMVGALYQLLPVVAGRSVPVPRLIGLVHASLVGGTLMLVAGLEGAPTLHAATLALGAAFGVFVAQVGYALTRPGPGGPTLDAMRLAVGSLVVLVGLGITMALRHADGTLGPERAPWLQAHLVFGLLGWVGALLSGVSWKVIPMFHLAPELPLGLRKASLYLVAAGLASTLLLLGIGSHRVAFGAAPAALAIWGLVPLATLYALANRRRRLYDAQLLFWQLSMCSGLLTGVAAIAALSTSDPRAPFLFGWVAIWGWAGAAVHGMTTRILPFLTWYHRSSGIHGAPTMRSLLPDVRARVAVALHATTLFAGIAAIATRSVFLSHFTGLTLVLTGTWLGLALVAVLAPRQNSVLVPPQN